MSQSKATMDPSRLKEIGRSKSKVARQTRETLIMASLFSCGVFSVLITVLIVFTLVKEAINFFDFDEVTLREFLFSGNWNPLLGGEQHFGVWALISGTLWVTGIAMVVALPLGLITAIYLSEYAPRKLRAFLKPVLEVIAGVPTVVFGFFAVTVITPALNTALGWNALPFYPFSWPHGVESYNVLSAGIAVGIMCVPIVCSLTEDALQAVPRALREGAYAVGGTKFDVSVRIVVPAAFSGIVAAFLLAVARAVGETMIVALAAGNLAQLSADPTQAMQTMTAYMVSIFLGDVTNLGVEYSSSYAVAMTLFIMTFLLTVVGHFIRVRFREEYE